MPKDARINHMFYFAGLLGQAQSLFVQQLAMPGCKPVLSEVEGQPRPTRKEDKATAFTGETIRGSGSHSKLWATRIEAQFDKLRVPGRTVSQGDGKASQ